MSIIRGLEYHSIIKNIFGDVKGLQQSEQLQVCCPRCQEREGLSHPDGKYNLEINTAKRVFKCWKCDEPQFSGSLGRLIKLYGSKFDYELYKSFGGNSDYVKYDNNDDNEQVIVNLPSEMILFSDLDIYNSEHLEAYNYLVLDRKIDREIIFKYNLGFCLNGAYAKRIIIPSYDINGNLNYFVGRSYNPNEKKMKYKNPPINKNNIIFNEGLVNWDSTVYLVEGVFDMLSFPVNTIPLLGKTISNVLFNKLKEIKPYLVILLDLDAYKRAIEIYYLLNAIYVGCEDKVRIVKLPTNDDIDKLREKYGYDEIINVIYNARGITTEDYFISKINNPYDRRKRYSDNSRYFEWK